MAGAVAAAVEPGGTLERLKAAADRLAALEDERRAEKERRDALIVEARDENRSWRSVAAAARCSISRCVAIVSGE